MYRGLWGVLRTDSDITEGLFPDIISLDVFYSSIVVQSKYELEINMPMDDSGYCYCKIVLMQENSWKRLYFNSPNLTQAVTIKEQYTTSIRTEYL